MHLPTLADPHPDNPAYIVELERVEQAARKRIADMVGEARRQARECYPFAPRAARDDDMDDRRGRRQKNNSTSMARTRESRARFTEMLTRDTLRLYTTFLEKRRIVDEKFARLCRLRALVKEQGDADCSDNEVGDQSRVVAPPLPPSDDMSPAHTFGDAVDAHLLHDHHNDHHNNSVMYDHQVHTQHQPDNHNTHDVDHSVPDVDAHPMHVNMYASSNMMAEQAFSLLPSSPLLPPSLVLRQPHDAQPHLDAAGLKRLFDGELPLPHAADFDVALARVAAAMPSSYTMVTSAHRTAADCSFDSPFHTAFESTSCANDVAADLYSFSDFPQYGGCASVQTGDMTIEALHWNHTHFLD